MISRRLAAIFVMLAFLAGMSVATFSEMRVFLPPLLKGAVVTLQVSALSALVFFLMSLLAGFGGLSRFRAIRWITKIYVEIFRGTALLVQLFWLFFVLPELGIVLSPLAAGVLGIGLNYGAYGAEIVRGAILSVPKGQADACTALNLPTWSRMVRIVFPQSFAIMVPSMGNLTIEMIKATSVVSAVTLIDITYASVLLNNVHYRTIEVFTVTLISYYLISQVMRILFSALEEWSSAYRPKRF